MTALTSISNFGHRRLRQSPRCNAAQSGQNGDWQTGEVIRPLASSESYDLVTDGLLLALAFAALFTFKDYAISNDEGVQHHFGERNGCQCRDRTIYRGKRNGRPRDDRRRGFLGVRIPAPASDIWIAGSMPHSCCPGKR